MAATKERAENIRDALQESLNHLIEARQKLTDAIELAKDDYPHNADILPLIRGSITLSQSSLAGEVSTWTGYAIARRSTR